MRVLVFHKLPVSYGFYPCVVDFCFFSLCSVEQTLLVASAEFDAIDDHNKKSTDLNKNLYKNEHPESTLIVFLKVREML